MSTLLDITHTRMHARTCTHLHEVPGTHPLVGHLVQEGLLPLPLRSPPSVGTLVVAEDDTCPPEEECACVSEECGGG